MVTDEQRAAIVAEAGTWVGTPFHHAARIKGAGVDCMQLVAAVYSAVGLIPVVQLQPYAPDWFLHRDDEKILQGVGRYFEPVVMGRPGDLVLFRFGRAVSHAGIVVQWPRIIHAQAEQLVQRANVGQQPRLAHAIAGWWSVRTA